jgi:hypothetical protein
VFTKKWYSSMWLFYLKKNRISLHFEPGCLTKEWVLNIKKNYKNLRPKKRYFYIKKRSEIFIFKLKPKTEKKIRNEMKRNEMKRNEKNV